MKTNDKKLKTEVVDSKLKLHLGASSCSSYQNIFKQKFDLWRSTSSKNTDQTRIMLRSSQFNEYVQDNI